MIRQHSRITSLSSSSPKEPGSGLSGKEIQESKMSEQKEVFARNISLSFIFPAFA